jgi:hypothetical protein
VAKNANFIRTGTILYIELSSSKINKKKYLVIQPGTETLFKIAKNLEMSDFSAT